MAVRQQVDWLTVKLRHTQIDKAPKPRMTRPSAAQVKVSTNTAAGKATRKPSSPLRVTTIDLPEALLPTRSAGGGFGQ